MGMGIGTGGNKKDRRSQIIERVPTALISVVSLVDAVFQVQWASVILKTDKKIVLQILTNVFSNIVCLCKVFYSLASILRVHFLPKDKFQV